MTDRSPEDKHRKLSGGVEGLTGHSDGTRRQRARETGNEQFAGAGNSNKEVNIVEWDFVESSEPWTRQRMAEYMHKWLTDNKLLRGPVDTPAFSQLVHACLLIQRVSIIQAKAAARSAVLEKAYELGKGDGNNLYKDIEHGRLALDLWSKAYTAISHMNLKGAQSQANAADINEDYLARFE